MAVAALKAGAIDYVVKTIGEDFFDLLARAIEAGARCQVSLRARRSAPRRSCARAMRASRRCCTRSITASPTASSSSRPSSTCRRASWRARARRRRLPIRSGASPRSRRCIAGSIPPTRSTSVDMAEYLSALLSELEETWSTPDSAARADAGRPSRCSLGTDKAVAVGVIVNELVSNACKYAYPPQTSEREVRVDLAARRRRIPAASVEDDGCGMPADGVVSSGTGSRLAPDRAPWPPRCAPPITYDQSDGNLRRARDAARHLLLTCHAPGAAVASTIATTPAGPGRDHRSRWRRGWTAAAYRTRGC